MKRKMDDRATFTRYTVAQDAYGDNAISSSTNLGTFWCRLVHNSASVIQREALQNQLITDYTLYFRKKSVSSILKGDIATIESNGLKVKINSIIEHDEQTIKMMVTSVE